MFNKKGFLFITSSSIVAIMGFGGIIGATLFPSLTAYLSRGHDTVRMAAVKEMSTVLSAYATDHVHFPDATTSGCLPETIVRDYIPKIPKDPSGKIATGCDGSDGTFVYRTFTGSDGIIGAAIGIDMESPRSGNSAVSLPDLLAQKGFIDESQLVLGSGKYYIDMRIMKVLY